jgi:hypothetical protein
MRNRQHGTTADEFRYGDDPDGNALYRERLFR